MLTFVGHPLFGHIFLVAKFELAIMAFAFGNCGWFLLRLRTGLSLGRFVFMRERIVQRPRLEDVNGQLVLFLATRITTFEFAHLGLGRAIVNDQMHRQHVGDN